MRKTLAWVGWPTYWLLLIVAYVLICSAVIRSASAHEWFVNQANPVTAARCCNGSDCLVIENEAWWEDEHGIIYVRWKNGVTYAIPANQAQPSQDKEGKAAACVWANQLRCFFMPVNF
jgi:hypothetical protein